MKKIVFLVGLLLFAASTTAQAEELKVVPGSRCIECGMICMVDSPFTSAMVDRSGKYSWFCDIGDLFIYQKNGGKGSVQSQKYVRDFKNNGRLKVENAFFVKSKSMKSPMGWGIAAFNSEKDAAEHGKVLSAKEIMGLLP